MYYLNLFIFLLLFFFNGCSQNFQNNGLSEKKIEKFNIKIGKTTKKNLAEKFGPPIFENLFNENVIYYILHNTSYKTFEKRKTVKLQVFEITLDNKDIVKNYKEYTEKDSMNINISEVEDMNKTNFITFWKDIVNAIGKKNIQN